MLDPSVTAMATETRLVTRWFTLFLGPPNSFLTSVKLRLTLNCSEFGSGETEVTLTQCYFGKLDGKKGLFHLFYGILDAFLTPSEIQKLKLPEARSRGCQFKHLISTLWRIAMRLETEINLSTSGSIFPRARATVRLVPGGVCEGRGTSFLNWGAGGASAEPGCRTPPPATPSCHSATRYLTRGTARTPGFPLVSLTFG